MIKNLRYYLIILTLASLETSFAQDNELHAGFLKKEFSVPAITYQQEKPVFTNYNITNQEAPQNEPTVRISRVNPDIVVAAWRDFRLGWQEPDVIRRIGYAYSHDGGITWSEAQLLPDPNPGHLSQSDPVLTSDSYGHFYLSSTSRQPVPNYNREMLVYKSTDDGVTFALHSIAVPGSGDQGEDKEWIFTDPVETNPTYDNIFIVWRSFGPFQGIKFRKSDVGGSNWSGTVPVSDSFFGQGANVASGTNGDIYVVWLGAGIMFDVSTDQGQSFGTDMVINYLNNNEHYSFPFICVDYSDKPSRGNIYVVWADNRLATEDIWFQRSTDGGDTWLTNPVRVNDETDNAQYWPAIQCDTSGRLCVVYYDERITPGRVDTYLAYSDDFGDTWTNTSLNQEPFFGNQPNSNVRFGDYIGIDAFAGKIVPVWTDDRTFDYNQEIYTAVVDIQTNTPELNPLNRQSIASSVVPNPFNVSARIIVRLSSPENFILDIFNAYGKIVETFSGRTNHAGNYVYEWHPADLASGIYFYRVQSRSGNVTKPIIYNK